MIVYVYNRINNSKIAKFTNVEKVTKDERFFYIFVDDYVIEFPRPETKLVMYDF